MITVPIIQDTQGQSVHLPSEFRVESKNVYIKKMGNVMVLIPGDNPWQTFFESLDLFTDDYMQDRGQPPQQEREDVFA